MNKIVGRKSCGGGKTHKTKTKKKRKQIVNIL